MSQFITSCRHRMQQVQGKKPILEMQTSDLQEHSVEVCPSTPCAIKRSHSLSWYGPERYRSLANKFPNAFKNEILLRIFARVRGKTLKVLWSFLGETGPWLRRQWEEKGKLVLRLGDSNSSLGRKRRRLLNESSLLVNECEYKCIIHTTVYSIIDYMD